MPKTKLAEKYSALKAPPIDWLWAAVLERRAQLGMSTKDLADRVGIRYDTLRYYVKKSPWDWPRHLREKVCSILGLKVMLDQSCIKGVEGA